MSKLRIAIDARLVFGTSTGDSTYWTGLVEGLQNAAGDFHVFLISRGPKPSGLVLDQRFEWISRPSSSSRWWSMVQFPLMARKLAARAIHTQYSLSPLVGKRGITTIHDVSFLIGPEWFKPRDRIVLSRSVPMGVKRARRVIAVSETCRKEIEDYILAAKGKTVVTYNACPSWIQAVDRVAATERVSAELGIVGPFLLTVGTRWPRKNMGLAIDAAGALADRYPHVLAVTGKYGWGDDGLGRRGRAVGYVSSELLSCLYSSADLYLAPSRHEGFGIPILEAFRCGCPVICSSGGALPEVAGDAALVQETWDSMDWASSMEMLLDDPSKLRNLRDRGLLREKQFSWLETAEQTLKVYREVAA
ncbi:MAG: glycosyltransferase family 1 protein [Fimbriimonas sp.]|nr:glycosyltransferase family 1 protein [Fimbriimonas sp.]